ncbi:MAG TPA: gamma-glutamyltransferase, partial [Negativicutes bacterium]|nr:gamma-glutamyltransferase [Negativicutes bacterium]
MGEKKKAIGALGLLVACAMMLATGCSHKNGSDAAVPEQAKRDVVAARSVVAAAHPLAAKAGVEILKKGGNAIDAAIATSLALGVVEPNASGPGGGGFAIVYIAKENKCYVVDFRETAPAKARPDMYELNDKGRPLNDAA